MERSTLCHKMVANATSFPRRGPSAAWSAILTAAEQNLIQSFNLELLNDILFPTFLNRRPTVNYVDPRLSIPKDWRDVYRYDADGNLLGWTRYDGRSVADFTPGGHLVVKKDPKGRPVMAREVRYEFNEKRKALELVPTDNLLEYR